MKMCFSCSFPMNWLIAGNLTSWLRACFAVRPGLNEAVPGQVQEHIALCLHCSGKSSENFTCWFEWNRLKIYCVNEAFWRLCHSKQFYYLYMLFSSSPAQDNSAGIIPQPWRPWGVASLPLLPHCQFGMLCLELVAVPLKESCRFPRSKLHVTSQ